MVWIYSAWIVKKGLDMEEKDSASQGKYYVLVRRSPWLAHQALALLCLAVPAILLWYFQVTPAWIKFPTIAVALIVAMLIQMRSIGYVEMHTRTE